MSRTNPFEGNGVYTKFVRNTYRRMMSRNWFAHADVMADHLDLKSSDDLPCGVSNCEHYGELKKAFRDIYSLVEEKLERAVLKLVETIEPKSSAMLAQTITLLRICRMPLRSKTFGLIHSFARTQPDSFHGHGLTTFSKIPLIFLKSHGGRRMGSR